MKLLILTDGVFPFVIGGMQKHSHYLAKFLIEQGHQITLVHCVGHSETLVTHEQLCNAWGLTSAVGFDSICLRFPKAGQQPGHYIRESFAYSEMIWKTIQDKIDTYDFVYAKGFSAWKLLHSKSRGVKMPPVGVKFHGYEMFQKPAGFKSWLQAWMLRGPVKWNNLKADYVFSYGGKITPLIRSLGVQENRIIEIPTGIDASWIRTHIRQTPHDAIQFVFVGRFERRKGVEELTSALKELIDQPGFHFHFVGPIPVSARIKDERMTYHGTIGDAKAMQGILDMCDVLVVPSHSEGMPNVIMEGMARGLSILATDVGAVSSVVDTSNGWFVEPGDSTMLKKMLQEIIAMDKSAVDARKTRSLEKIRSFTWQEIARMTAKKIESIL